MLWGACDALGDAAAARPADRHGGDRWRVHSRLPCREGEKPHAVFLALVEELRAVQPTIAVIEDVHWADEATLDVIRLLARRAETLGALVVITYRESELEASHPVRLAVGELGTAPGVSQLRLPPLSRDAVEELARPHGVDAEELYVKTAGNPFFVTEVLAGGGTAVPPTVRDAVLGRMSRLGDAAQGVLEAVAVVPPHVEMWVLDEVVPEEVVHLDACLAAGMLRGEGRTVSFRHELARLAVEQSIGPHRRVLLHRRVLEALRNPPEGAPTDPAQLAYHAEAAGNAARSAAACDGRRAARGSAGRAPRSRSPVRARPAVRLGPRSVRARRPARAARARVLPHESDGRRGGLAGARARVPSRARRSPPRVDGALLAVGDALVSRQHRRVRAREPRVRWRCSKASSRGRELARAYVQVATLSHDADDHDRVGDARAHARRAAR